MDITGKTVAILVDNYFEQAEFEEPIEALRDAGAEVTVVAVKDKKLQGLNHIDKGDFFAADLLLEEASEEDYDALVLPGGAINADSLRMVEAAQIWVRDFLEEDKPVAVICHAPWVLVSADLLDGRRLTSFETIQDDIQNAGGDWVDEPVVIDGYLITSRKPDDLPAFSEALIKMIREGGPSSETPEAIESSTKDAEDPTLDARATEDEVRLRELGYDRRRDEISKIDEEEILQDELAEADEDDPDALHLSGIVPQDEQDGTE
jgi:protease I